jgi:hypothetical protein
MIADGDQDVEELPSCLAEPLDARVERRETGLEPQQDIREVSLVSESLGERERRASYRVGDSWSRSTTFDLRSGLRLSVDACRFAPTFSFPVIQPPAELELVVSKGGAVQVRTTDGRVFRRGGNTLELGRTKRPVQLHVHPDSDVSMESLTVSLGEWRLRELLGARELPQAFRRVTERPTSSSRRPVRRRPCSRQPTSTASSVSGAASSSVWRLHRRLRSWPGLPDST